MAVSKNYLGVLVETVNQAAHTLSVTLVAGTARKIVVQTCRETSVTVTGVTFNAASLTNVAGASIANTTDTQVQADTWYYDVPNALAAGAYNVVVTTSAANPNVTFYVTQLSGALSGAPLDADETEWSTGSTNATLTLTTADGSAMLALAITGAAASTWTISGDLTEEVESDETNYTSVLASALIPTGTSDAVTATVSAVGTGNKCLVATAWAPVVGPTIDTQPTAQTARLNGESAGPTATFTVAATTSGGTLVYDWELEDGVASGVYANVADGNGATWTGITGTSLVGTFTATTLTGRRVRCNVTDDNGTSTTNAVALTVLNGPVVTASSSASNGSGVATLAYHSDDALTTNGELLLWTATVRGVDFYIVTRPS